MHVADRSRVLERIIPGVDTERFLSHDIEYIKAAVFSLIESLTSEKKLILKDVLKLADTYGLKQSEVGNIHINSLKLFLNCIYYISVFVFPSGDIKVFKLYPLL